MNNNNKGKISYDINTTEKHDVPRETRVLSFLLGTKISKLQALTIVSKISFSLAKEEKVTKDKSGLFKATLVFSVFKLG